MQSRHKVLFGACEEIYDFSKEIDQSALVDPLSLASVDVFVDKAQSLLTSRAKLLFAIGIVCALPAVALLLYVSYRLYHTPLSSITENTNPLDGYILTIIALKSTTTSAFAAGAVYVLVSMAKAFLHEATVLFNRRHALRFGRLYLYIKKGDVSLDEIQRVFKWNDEFATAFKEIKVDGIAKTIAGQLADAPKALFETMTRAGKK
ncbi:hypothetical protein HQ394_08580 [Defluviicoccus vanus]|uniref:Uncharacterized protein n=1 Tax=Defluviicoccus vanus TaxID=111831 RepID=A0A7H1N0X7_9PROT|nr:hypothetical protein HQ394_08580 [Defluviicoccus vanus]